MKPSKKKSVTETINATRIVIVTSAVMMNTMVSTAMIDNVRQSINSG